MESSAFVNKIKYTSKNVVYFEHSILVLTGGVGLVDFKKSVNLDLR